MPVTDRTSPILALLASVGTFLVLWQVRYELDRGAVIDGNLWRTLDASVLYIIVLAPGAVAAYLVPSRWLGLGVLAAYLAAVTGQLVRLAIAVVQSRHHGPVDLPSAVVLADIAISSLPDAILGVAGSALGLVLARRSNQGG